MGIAYEGVRTSQSLQSSVDTHNHLCSIRTFVLFRRFRDDGKWRPASENFPGR
jgi:hypothetical protein